MGEIQFIRFGVQIQKEIEKNEDKINERHMHAHNRFVVGGKIYTKY